MVFKWHIEHVPIFLRLYEQHPCLWDHRLSSYRNHISRKAAMNSIIWELNYKGLTEREIRLKIKTLRTRYAAELKKIEESKIKSRTKDDIYVPTLPWFEQADKFLSPVYNLKRLQKRTKCINTRFDRSRFRSYSRATSRSSIESQDLIRVDPEEVTLHEAAETGFDRYTSSRFQPYSRRASRGSIESQDLIRVDPEEVALHGTAETGFDRYTSSRFRPYSRRASWSSTESQDLIRVDPEEIVLHEAAEAPSPDVELVPPTNIVQGAGYMPACGHNQPGNDEKITTIPESSVLGIITGKDEDEIDMFGKDVARRMRSLSPSQKLFAQSAIYDALFEAQLKEYISMEYLKNN